MGRNQACLLSVILGSFQQLGWMNLLFQNGEREHTGNAIIQIERIDPTSVRFDSNHQVSLSQTLRFLRVCTLTMCGVSSLERARSSASKVSRTSANSSLAMPKVLITCLVPKSTASSVFFFMQGRNMRRRRGQHECNGFATCVRENMASGLRVDIVFRRALLSALNKHIHRLDRGREICLFFVCTYSPTFPKTAVVSYSTCLVNAILLPGPNK